MCLFSDWMQRQQCKSFVLFSSCTVKVLVWQEFKLILQLTVCSKQIDEKRSQAASLYNRIISATMVIAQTCNHIFRPKLQVNWLDTLTVKQWEIMINKWMMCYCFCDQWGNTLQAALSLLIFLIVLKIIHCVFLVLFSLSNENRFDYTFWHSSFCRYWRVRQRYSQLPQFTCFMYKHNGIF